MALKFLLLATAFGLALLSSELIVRILAPQPPSWAAIYRNHPHLPFFALDTHLNTVIDTGETRWRVITDENGFRIGSNPAPDPNAPLALVLGDSFAFGQGVNYEASLVGLLSARRQTGFRYVNASVGGYGPVQYSNLLRYLLSSGMRPDRILVICYMGNDFHDCIWNKNAPVVDGIIGNKNRSLKAWLRRNSHVYRLLAKCYHLYWPGSVDCYAAVIRELGTPSSWEHGRLRRARELFADQMTSIVHLCDRHRIRLAVVLIPPEQALLAQPTDIAPSLDHSLACRNAAVICRQLNIPYLDLTEPFALYEAEELFFRHDGHLTAFGHQVAASATASFIEDSDSASSTWSP